MTTQQKRAIPFIALIILGAVAIRVWASFNELWIDEIWSLGFASEIKSPLDVFTIHHDNNHYLNTLYMWIVGQGQHFFIYRIISLISGTALIIIASLISLRRNVADGIITAILLGYSYIFILYTANARGFMPMLLFGYLSYLSLEKYLKKPALTYAILFGITASLAFLWHLTYLFLYLPLLVWTLYSLVDMKTKSLLHLVQLHILPFLLLKILYILDFQYMQVGGGSPTFMRELFASTISATIGTPETGLLSVIAIGIVLLVIIKVIIHFHDRNFGMFLFLTILFLGTTIGVVFAGMVMKSGFFFFPRYFLPCAFAFLIIVSALLAHCYSKGGFRRAICILSIIIFFSGNIPNVLNVVRRGKEGTYFPVINYLETRTQEPTITFGSNRDSRTTLITQYYFKLYNVEKTYEYIAAEDFTKNPSEWYFYERQDVGWKDPPPPYLSIKDSNEVYTLQEDAPHKDTFWILYRRTN